jgi:recombinational DNA repair protein RecR
MDPADPCEPCEHQKRRDQVKQLQNIVSLGRCKPNETNVFIIIQGLLEAIKKPAPSQHNSPLPANIHQKIYEEVLFDTSYDATLLNEAVQTLSKWFPSRDQATIDRIAMEALQSIREERIQNPESLSNGVSSLQTGVC